MTFQVKRLVSCKHYTCSQGRMDVLDLEGIDDDLDLEEEAVAMETGTTLTPVYLSLR